MAISRDGKTLFTAPVDPRSAAQVYDVDSGLLRRELPDVHHRLSAGAIGLSPDGSRLAVAVGEEGGRRPPSQVLALDLKSGAKAWAVDLPFPPESISYTGDGKHLLELHGGPRTTAGVEIADTRNGRGLVFVHSGKRDMNVFPLLSASPDGKSLSGIFDGDWRMAEVATGKLTTVLKEQVRAKDPRQIDISPSGSLAALTSADGVLVVDTATGDRKGEIAPPDPPGFISSAVFLDDHTVLLTGGGVSWEWEVGAKAPRRSFGPPIAPQGAVAFSADDSRIATGLDNGMIALWDPLAAMPVAHLEGHAAAITALAFSGDGRALISASRDGTVRIWDLGERRTTRVLAGHGGPVNALSISPDGKLLASGSDDRTVRLWDLASGAEVRAFAQAAAAFAVAFSPDGCQLAAGGQDATVRVLDVRSGASGQVLKAETAVRGIFWIGGAELVTEHAPRAGTLGGTLARWELSTGHELPIKAHASVTSVAQLGASSTLAVAGWRRGEILVVDVASPKATSGWELLRSRQAASWWRGGLALSHGGDLLAQGSYDGLSIHRPGSREPEVMVRANPRLTAVLVTTPDGYFDILGPDAESLRRLSRCGSDGWSLPLEVCEERFRVPGLLANVMTGDDSFREP
jgi:WD40 repeat protein